MSGFAMSHEQIKKDMAAKQAQERPMLERDIWQQTKASGGVGAEPRNPTLTEKIKQLSERVTSLHIGLSDVERRLDPLINSDTLQGDAAGKPQNPMNADAELALCLESLAHLEGRMATMANRMERYL